MARYDIAVLGAGPAGMAAAATAASGGASVVVLDENPKPGGQAYRAPTEGVTPHGGEWRIGERLRARLVASGAAFLGGSRVWGIAAEPSATRGAPARFRLDVLGPESAFALDARALIVCAGTHERVVPFPGWTLPGVIGLAGATILLKAQGVSPGRRAVVAGSGPLLGSVAAGLLNAGSTIAAIIDLAPRQAWITALPGLTAYPRLLARGVGWMLRVAQHRVPVLSGWRIARALGTNEVEAVEVEPLASSGAPRRIACDALLVGHGLVPATEATRLLGAEHVFRRMRGGWVPVHDGWQRSSVSGLYVAGDGAGVSGAHAAPITGSIAAHAALTDLGVQPAKAALVTRLRRRLAASARFSAALARVWMPPEQLTAVIPSTCIVCRCEDLTRAEIDAAVDAGAHDLNQLKQFTRCGMGPCQGRMCGEAAADLLAARCGGRDAVGSFTARIPLRPVTLERLVGRFDYADIPIPAPAPI